jgi:Xaa-Pro aminopeptidase
MNRKKIPSNRDKREFMPWKDLWKLAKKQRLICGICKKPEYPLAKDRRYTVLDHIDPQRIDFNHPDNLQAAHEPCNAMKNAKNQTEVSKMRQLEKLNQQEEYRPEP